jgi:hypothetical protein
MTDADPEDEEKIGRELHDLMLKGDVTASARVAELFLPKLTKRLSARSKTIDPHMIDTAVADTLLDYFKKPEKYHPTKLPLGKFLLMSADRDLKNLLARRTRDLERLGFTENVEVEGRAPEQCSEQREEKLANILKALQNETDKKIVSLMADGVRKTETYAAVLGIGGLPKTEQAKLVKRQKDRLLKMLQRARAKIAKGSE